MQDGNEQWRSVPGYEGLYEISSHGRVRRLPRSGKSGGILPSRILKQSMSNGYRYVGLRDEHGKHAAHRIHTLVAFAFLGPRPEGMVINHIDFDKLNNLVSNLEYVTQRENIQHSVRHGRFNGALTAEEVQALRSLVSRDPAIDLEYLSKRMGVTKSVLVKVLTAESYSLIPNKDGSAPKPIVFKRSSAICLEDIQDFIALGFSIPQISKYYKVDYSTPYQMLRRAGIWQESSPSSKRYAGARVRARKQSVGS